MSGIVGILNRDGAPLQRQLLQSFARLLSYRGPDARDVWVDEHVGFAHTLLRTARESINERQPVSLDSLFWITADVRLDSREELRSKLETFGRKIPAVATDAELVLHSYAVWTEGCVRHLRGDFSFGIWDARRERLFCARDHFGIKPFYYADLPSQFVFSNTLDCLLAHPEVSKQLHADAVADFLLFGLNCDPTTTTYRDIRRLPPAHSLVVSRELTRIERYWTPPIDGRIRYRRADDYIEHFQLVLQQAVSDRLRTHPVGIFLSGGLDSGAIAAVAREVSSQASGSQSVQAGDASDRAADLRAYTVVYQSLLADPERPHARSTAEFLRIPLHFLPADDLRPFSAALDPGAHGDAYPALPEPMDDPLVGGLFDQFRVISKDCRVILCGEGNDNLMHFQMWPYMRDLLRNRKWRRALLDGFSYLRVRPIPWRGIRQRAQALLRADPYAPVFPRWIAPSFARRMNLEARWEERTHLQGPFVHPLLPKAHASLSLPHWSYLFEQEEPGATRLPVEVRYPFLDLRVVDFVLGLPPFPWLFNKTILREAMVGRLPEEVRMRPKTPLAADPLALALQHHGTSSLDRVDWTEEARQFIDPSALEPLAITKGEELSVRLRPLCLNFWLQSVRRPRYNFLAETRNG